MILAVIIGEGCNVCDGVATEEQTHLLLRLGSETGLGYHGY